jgi:hypothetical protein
MSSRRFLALAVEMVGAALALYLLGSLESFLVR